MARRSPARVRAAGLRRPDQPVSALPSLSSRGRAAIADLERTRFWPGAAREALDAYTRLLREPYHRLFDAEYGCGVLACCPGVDELRPILHAVAQALPRRDARQFRRQIAALDERW
jgi:hypothetical protein